MSSSVLEMKRAACGGSAEFAVELGSRGYCLRASLAEPSPRIADTEPQGMSDNPRASLARCSGPRVQT